MWFPPLKLFPETNIFRASPVNEPFILAWRGLGKLVSSSGASYNHQFNACQPTLNWYNKYAIIR